ncbi:MAG TPA: Gfo/Idh/MocA family oxidoreductase [Bauldia sp.]|nr:Gfo/Idh/MocA family oxidoreductase [Bauldia sp.]
MTATRIGLVGCGAWGKFILRDLKALGAEVSVVARSETSVRRARQYGADTIVPGLDELPADLAGIVVAVPTNLHGPVVEALLPRGVPIFVEKALTSDIASAERIVARAGERVFVMDKWRYHPGVEALRQLAQSGRLGRLLAIRSHRWGWSLTHDEVDPIWLLAPHDLAIAYHILGRMPTATDAAAMILNLRAAEFWANLAERDVLVRIELSTLRPINQRGVVVVGEEAAAELNGSYAESITIRAASPGTKDAPEEHLPIPSTMPLETELRRFLDTWPADRRR